MAANMEQLAKKIFETVGGEDNISVVNHCATRLRLTLNDAEKVDCEAVKKIPGVMGLVKRDDEVQVIIGTDVGKVYSEFIKLGKFKKTGKVDDNGKKKGAGAVFGKVIDFVSGTFVPVLPVLVAGGLISAVLTICTTFFGLGTESGTYTILMAIYNAAFFFLPIFVGYSAANKLGVNPPLGALLGGVLVFSSINGAAGLDFLGIPVTTVTYNGSVVPIILGVLFMAVIYKPLDRFVPKEVKFFVVPLVTMLITVPVTLIVLGPLGGWIGTYLASALQWVNETLGWFSVGLMGLFTPLLVMTGMNQALFPLCFAEFDAFGFDPFVLPGMLAANVAVGAAALAVWVKSKNKNIKALSLSAGLTGVFGITEPSIFGVLLRFKRPFIGAMAGGFVGGIFAGIVHLAEYSIVSPGVASILAFINPDGTMTNFYMAIITMIIAAVVAFITTWVLGFEDEPEEAEA